MGGESKWRKMKQALGFTTCFDVSEATGDGESRRAVTGSGSSSDVNRRMPVSPTPSSRFSSKSLSEHICAICLMAMKSTNSSHKIFRAECSHSFHFHCIASNVKHGNKVCPICRAKWKEIPVEKPGQCVKSGTNTATWSDQEYTMVAQDTSPQQRQADGNIRLPFQAPEPAIFDDDELVNPKAEDIYSGDSDIDGEIEMKTYPEVSAVAGSASFDNFGILINLKAPITERNSNERAPIDLVTMLDVSSSMAGTKIALLKQAMGFVVHNLGPSDRLSVIAFSSTAHRLFPLRRMTETGKQESLRMIHSLPSSGGTDIHDALRIGAKVLSERKFKNPVSSMILLSDGQDTSNRLPRKPLESDYMALLPSSIQVNENGTCIPIHTFGFGMDHDACAMHYISEFTGGTFSFIEAGSMIQDAFAQCIGGLLSVVIQELRVEVECIHPVLCLRSIKSGSYKVGMDETRRTGFIEVGDLYAEEERNFLVSMDIPVEETDNEMSLVKFRVIHNDPIKKTMVTVSGNDVIISRPKSLSEEQIVSMEVDRQRNRLDAASAIAEALMLAERGNLTAAISVLADCQEKLMDSVSGRGGDQLCAGLVMELGEMRNRMVNLRVYESTGRAYVLSGLSSHSWQRATARGDSTDMTSRLLSYQTTSMVNMVNLSQTMCFSRSPITPMVNVDPTAAAPGNDKSLSLVHSCPLPQP